MSEKADLLDFLRNLASHLALGTTLDLDAILPALGRLKEHLQELYSQYEAPAPEGAEVIRDYMLEALELFFGSIEEIEGFLEDADRERLARAVVSAEEADDILGSIEYVIQQNQQWLSEYSLG